MKSILLFHGLSSEFFGVIAQGRANLFKALLRGDPLAWTLAGVGLAIGGGFLVWILWKMSKEEEYTKRLCKDLEAELSEPVQFVQAYCILYADDGYRFTEYMQTLGKDPMSEENYPQVLEYVLSALKNPDSEQAIKMHVNIIR